MINLLTVCTDEYPMEYARKLITRFKELTELEVNVYCVTDRPDEISDIATPIDSLYKGWWNKVYLYSNDMPEGWNVYLDIDTVLIHNFDDEILKSIEANKKVACVSDAINWMGNKFSSSMMVFKTGAMSDVYDEFKCNSFLLQDFAGGDQVWTGNLLQSSDVFYIDDKVNFHLKANLKFHLAKKVFGQWQFPQEILSSIKIVDCGGQPKPNELKHLSYIKENWHDVETR